MSQKRLQQLKLETLKALVKGLIFETWRKIVLREHAIDWEGGADTSLAGFELSLAEK